jgi:ATP-dependent exoDNAse (exonuclease V) beta subunit
VAGSRIELSVEQRAAILTPGNVIVRAGAGSGKTEVLARRFVALVAGDIEGRAPLMPEWIAAMTFTEKATIDMRARIAAVIDERLAENNREDLQAHLVRAKRTLGLARISTIHAFCTRILRENPLEAGLDPDFEVIDEYESQTFLTRVCEQGLVDAVRGDDPGAIRLASARGLRPLGFREGAVDIAVRLIREARRLGRPPGWINETAHRTAAQIATNRGDVARLAGQLCAYVDQLPAPKELRGQTADQVAGLRAKWPRLRGSLLAFDADSGPEIIELLRDLDKLIPDARAAAVKEMVKAIRELLCRSSGAFGLDGELIRAWGAQRSIRPTLEVAALIDRITVALDDARRRDRVATFDDLLELTLRMLDDASSGVVDRYRTDLHALLVDEYQDTDPLQNAIVSRLTDPRGADPGPELFIVGDEKQSIYRFRGADVAVFNRQRDPAPRALPLHENRRSTPNILNFVNALAAHVMRPGIAPAQPYRIEWNDDHRLRAVRGATHDPPVELITAVGGVGAAVEKRDLEARAIARRILELIGSAQVIDPGTGDPRAAALGDIAILLRAFTDVAIYERALVAAGIDCYTVKGRGFYGCPEVIDLIELLAALNDPRDSLALAAALRSPFFAISDNSLFEMGLYLRDRPPANDSPRSIADLFAGPAAAFGWLIEGRAEADHAWTVLHDLRAICGREPAAIVIERALELTGYEAVMAGMPQGRQRVANLRKLVELARGFESRHFFTFHDFTVYLRRLAEEEPYEAQEQILGENENVVRLMTVHQAKGLEFPIVIVADLGRNPPHDNRVPMLDPEYGLLVNDTVGSGDDEIPNALAAAYRERIRDEESAEAARILYVAMTRARDYLVLSEGAFAGGWAAQVREFAGKSEVERFAVSGPIELPLDRVGVHIVLRRPATAPFDSPAAVAPAYAVRADQIAELARRRLAFAPATIADLVMTPTALAAFDRCPRQYRWRDLGIEEHQSAAVSSAAPNGDALALGNVAHAILERIDLASNGASARQIETLAQSLGAAAGLDSKQRSAIARDLSGYVAALGMSATLLAREVPFFMRIGGGLFVRGQIDALAAAGARLLVRDYKYARAAEEAHLYQVQMECYGLAAMEAYAGRPVAAEIIFLRGGARTVPVTLPSADEIRVRFAAIGDALRAAHASGEFPRKPDGPKACRALGCGYVPRCWGH